MRLTLLLALAMFCGGAAPSAVFAQDAEPPARPWCAPGMLVEDFVVKNPSLLSG